MQLPPKIYFDTAPAESPCPPQMSVFGATPFAYKFDREGRPAQPSAASHELDNGTKMIVTGEGMASLFLGNPDQTRPTVDPADAKWWDKDFPIFMEEALTWPLARYTSHIAWCHQNALLPQVAATQ